MTRHSLFLPPAKSALTLPRFLDCQESCRATASVMSLSTSTISQPVKSSRPSCQLLPLAFTTCLRRSGREADAREQHDVVLLRLEAPLLARLLCRHARPADGVKVETHRPFPALPLFSDLPAPVSRLRQAPAPSRPRLCSQVDEVGKADEPGDRAAGGRYRQDRQVHQHRWQGGVDDAETKRIVDQRETDDDGVQVTHCMAAVHGQEHVHGVAGERDR